MKSRGGKSQRREEKKKEDQKRESPRRKKMQVREKVGKSRNTVFFQWFEAPEGRKVGSRKRRVWSQLARWEMKNCTPLWREAHFQDFPSQNAQNTQVWTTFGCRKRARRCGAKHISKTKCRIHTSFGPLLEVEMSKKCTPLWREAHFQVKMYKAHQLGTTFGSWDVEKVHTVVARSTCRSQKWQKLRGTEHFWTFRCRFAWQAHGIVHPVKKWEKREDFVAYPKTMASVGHLTRIYKDALSVAGAVQETCYDMFIRAVRKSRRWFPESGCILERQIFRFAEMILCDRCSMLYDLVSLFRGRRSSLDRWNRKIAKRIGTRLSALHSTFHFYPHLVHPGESCPRKITGLFLGSWPFWN